ncbi:MULTISPECIES: N-acetyl-gamma-glutamyl-phosphate reductase [unclassified Sphingobium]|uniref:N-acetyl-gamma-glutamyl-phosphate reductase n=1 Tax=unclassified Sphingobium TaxID=2611147 RepID=UPI00222553C4|nr:MULTISPECIES: N-acetyl-gamma-glutamyl-phosphate reductase [unclassified Sphingobium]MCW2393721.1 N-acetyl-gamma-glutamyl-phosphate reductase [Sphingobium sp. B8D3B]MCW2417234.1 N-acetyl-gamma-glutamyl-phosphate reductase [Sphingobium sp. B8D3C]
MTKIFIDGAAGTTGIQIRDRLEGRSEFDLITLGDAARKDDDARAEAINAADIVILCLPDDAARQSVQMIANDRTRVIDASTAHRVADGWVYGMPEVSGHDAVAKARFVSNPGCYSTGFIALVAPLVKAGIIPAETQLTCNAASGYSGGGKAMIAEYEGADGAPSAFRTYALGLGHKHVPEMQARCGLTHRPLFAPAVVPVYSGMIVDVPLHRDLLANGADAGTIRAALAEDYAGSPIISVADGYEAATLPIELLRDKDIMRLFVFADENSAQIRLVAALDNLGKGASGAAVQNLNLMAGLPETTGLRL